MEVIIPGHQYLLDSFEGEDKQTLQFIHKESVNFVLTTIADGTTNEEVLKVLIDRIKLLNEKFPCRENSIVITKLEESLMWLEYRTKQRISQNVEGKQLPHKS